MMMIFRPFIALSGSLGLVFMLVVMLLYVPQAGAQTGSLSINAELRTEESATVLDRISTRLGQGDIFYAQMEHYFKDGFTDEEVTTEGEVWVAENGYKIITSGQHISVQNEVSTVYNRAENKVIISTYYPEDDDFAPSRLLGSYEDRFEITGVETPEEGLRRVSLASSDPFEIITSARLLIEAGSLLPQGMFAEDQTGNTYETSFRNGAFLPADEVDFTLEWPENAEIIDLRE